MIGPPPDPFNFPQQEARRSRHLLRRAMGEIERSGQVILGPGVAGFEADFAAWLDPRLEPDQVVGVASGTDALELALRACGVQSGDAVALPSHTAYASLAAVLRLGGRPVFLDVAAGRSVLCPDHLEAALGDRSLAIRAVIAVHLYGEVCELARLTALCAQRDIPLIEDCAQSCGSLQGSRPVGRAGRFACFSFYPTKNLAACGDGGAVVASRREDAAALRRLRCYGWDDHRAAVQFGVNSRLDELQAWLLKGKLPDLDRRIAQRRRVAAWYRAELAGETALTLPADGVDWSHSYHLYVVQVEPPHRDRLLQICRRGGIPAALHYPLACHQHPYVIERFGRAPSLPRTEALLARILSLPLHPHLSRRQVRRVSAVVRAGLAEIG